MESGTSITPHVAAPTTNSGRTNLAFRSAAPAILIALLTTLPFLGKAYTNDDVTFLLQAKQVLVDPWHPTAFDMVFHGERIRLSHEMVSGPIMAYLLLPSLFLQGAEWPVHLIQVAFLIAGLVATSSLCLRLGIDEHRARLATILVAATPAVIAMTSTAMPDVAAMALSVLGIERMVAWKNTGRWQSGLMATLWLVAATLARPHTLLLTVGLCVYLVDARIWAQSPRRWVSSLLGRPVLPLFVLLLVLVLATYLMRDPTSGAHLAGTAAARLYLDRVPLNLASFSLQLAVTFPFAILWLCLRGRAAFGRVTAIAFAAGILVAGLAGVVQLGPLIGIGTAATVDLALVALRERDQLRLFLLLWILISLSAVTYFHLLAKHLVPSAPAMAIAIASFPQARLRHYRPMILTTVAAGMVLGVLVSRADARQAEIGRLGGRVVAEQVKLGRPVWFDGAWGFQWYSMQAGASALATTAPFPRPGDIVVAGVRARVLRASNFERTLVERHVFAQPGGRVMSEGAGFYLSGRLPWTWGTEELGRIEVWRIDQASTSGAIR